MKATRWTFDCAMFTRGGLGAGVAAAVLAATPAHALSIVQTLSQDLLGGNAYDGQFDISPQLSSGGDSYRVVSAKVIAKGSSTQQLVTTVGPDGSPAQYDAEQRIITPAQPIYQQVCFLGVCHDELIGFTNPVIGTDRFFNVDHTVTRIDAFDQMRLDVGEGLGVGGSQTRVTGDSGLLQLGSVQPQGLNETGGLDFYRFRARTITDAWFGSIQAQAVLTAGDLTGLNDSGILAFTVGATTGRFTLTDLELQFDLEKIEVAAVPEPASWALMILGFVAAGTGLRRRRSRIA